MSSSSATKTLFEHLQEIRSRLFWILISVTLFSVAGYFLNTPLLAILTDPLKQPIYYLSPTGGFEVVLKISILFGVTISAPVITYHLYRFLEPAMPYSSKKILISFLLSSWILMIVGISFAYFLSLPAALNFLSEFGGNNVKSLISTDTYFSFVFRYLGGFALLFQLPLILLIINQMKRLQPWKLLSNIRYVILISFIVAAIITPTPDPVNQSIMAFPIIILYLVSVGIIWMVNKKQKSLSIKASPKPSSKRRNS